MSQYDAEAPMTSEQQNTMAGYAQKLDQMTGGASGGAAAEKQAVAAKSTEAAMPQPPTPARQELDKIMKDSAGSYWDGNHPDHAKTMQRVRQLMVAESVARGEGDDFRNADHPREDVAGWAARMRAGFGIERPDLPEGITREENFDLHEGDFLAWSASMGIEPPLMQEMYSDVHKHVIAGDGRLTQQSIEELERAYTPKLGAKNVEVLKRWWLTEIQPS